MEEISGLFENLEKHIMEHYDNIRFYVLDVDINILNERIGPDYSYLKHTPFKKLVVVKDPRSDIIDGYLHCENIDKQHASTILADLIGCYPSDIFITNIEFMISFLMIFDYYYKCWDTFEYEINYYYYF